MAFIFAHEVDRFNPDCNLTPGHNKKKGNLAPLSLNAEEVKTQEAIFNPDCNLTPGHNKKKYLAPPPLNAEELQRSMGMKTIIYLLLLMCGELMICPSPQIQPTQDQQKVPIEIKMQCCKNFRDGTMWEQPPCCAVCGCEHRDATIWKYYVSGDAVKPGYGLDLLQATDQTITQSSYEFVFGNQAINSLMLVASALSSKPYPKLPKFALKNKLYHGHFPDEFKDITWIEEKTDHAQEIFEQDTAGVAAHPASQLYNSQEEANPNMSMHVMLESTGICDPDDPIQEYNNPNSFPGMFPTLYPFGIGGFEDETREIPISLQAQYHCSFMFIALNIYQHHASHLHSALTVKKSNYDYIAQKLVSLSPELIQRVAKHIENEGKISDLTTQEKNVMTLLKQVNIVSAKIPGSSASKLQVWNEICAYMGYFGLPHLYMTLNPNAMYGDDLVDLSLQSPQLVDAAQHAI
ncbi:hypothetical protein BS47DRAFT_1360950 [Hydnum rufescens UP504]|uniref:Helitron helicase-like domain-containing protein n=1 Tax=Hydnum rufescens UP504 TaxID=1448309 RepID=A0A9P6B106_9AGAM|nr:hypothetical protein BS47DRAFT_1360950 [Hydnum rufescens UP504]